jgi:hypothetical protein
MLLVDVLDFITMDWMVQKYHTHHTFCFKNAVMYSMFELVTLYFEHDLVADDSRVAPHSDGHLLYCSLSIAS